MNFLIKFLTLLICTVFTMNLYAHDASSPVGYWKTIDDVTGKPKSIIEIYETSDHTLNGRVLRIYPSPGKDQNEVCDACKGENHNRRIDGMVVLTGMTQDKDEWGNGEILDPKNGKTYHCKMHVIDGGAKLSVRGYIGFSLLGRTQTWLRVSRP